MAGDPLEEIKALGATLSSVEAVLDLPRLRREIAELERQASAPDLWDDQAKAQQVTSRLSVAQAQLNRVSALRGRLEDLPVLFELAGLEQDAAVQAEAEAELVALRAAVGELEVLTLLSGEYDERPALVSIHAGTGGIDAKDWAAMLLRMYLRWAERHGHPVEVYDTSYDEEAGINSATFAVQVPFGYGTLAGEHGVHRLVRISPFDNQSRRQTSFAGVDVTPVVAASDHVEIDESELRIDIFRSSGPGGQGVNTTDSAVRITHLPTGIVVTCQNERSQLQNKASALTVLSAKLLERRRQEEEATMDRLRGSRNTVGFGSDDKVRDYVLHPYQMVKDARTKLESGNVQAVLDGSIDDFVEAEIRWRRSAPEG
jgi:peptide chain release factor 2